MNRTKGVGLPAYLLLAGIAAASVTKTTTKTPPNFTGGMGGSSIGLTYGFQGPGAIAGTTAGALSVFSGTLTKSAEGTTKLSYDATGGNHSRLLTATIVGVSISSAKKLSLFGLGGGSMKSENKLQYIVTKEVDGDVQVVLSDEVGTLAQTGGSGFKMKPLFKFYSQLVSFSTHAGLEAKVGSHSSIKAKPLSLGLANGQIMGIVIGVP